MSSTASRGAEMIAIVSVLVALAAAAVGLRVFARIKRRVQFGIDDYLCFFALAVLLSMLIELILWCTIGGNGKHQDSLDVKTMLNFGKLTEQIFLANQFSYFALCPAIKTSIVCFYRRVFTTQSFQRFSFGLNTLIVAWGAAIFIACGLQCRPLRGFWDPMVPSQCMDQNKFLITNQIFNVIIDFVILGLPIPMIWNLQRAWQDKLALNGVFALGIFVCFASIYRIVVLFWINPADTTYTVYQATLWTHIEPSIGLICACLPIIRGLFPRLKFSGSGRKYASAPYYLSNDHSTLRFATTSTGPRSPGIDEYFKMEEGLASRPTTGRDETSYPLGIAKDTMGTRAIAVRTEIEIDASSMKADK